MNKSYNIAKLLNFFRYLGDALFAAFLPLFFKSLDLSSLKIGTLLAAVPFMAIIGNIVIAFLAKCPKRNLNLLRFLAPIEALGVALIGFFSNFYIVLTLTFIIFFCNSSSFSLLESVSSHIASTTKRNYMKMRLFGSIAYLISSFFGGTIIKMIDYRFTFLIAAGIYMITFFILLTLKFKEDSTETKTNSFKAFISIWKNKSFVFYVIFYLLVIGSCAVGDNFFALLAKDKGINESSYGMIYSMMIAVEIISMLIVIWLKIKNYKVLLLISAGFILTRSLVLCFDLPKAVLFAVPALRGVGWGVMLAAHLNLLKSFLPEEKMSYAIFGATIALQTFNTILNQIGPSVIEKTSYNFIFSILTGLTALGSIILLITKFKKLQHSSAKQKDR